MKSIIITLQNDKITLPASHNQMLQGVIYKLLSADPEYSERLHGSGSAHFFKFFTFSKFNGKGTHNNQKVTFTGNIKFEVRSAIDRTIDIIAEQLDNHPSIMLGKQLMPVYSAKIQQKHIYTDEITVAMLTPVTIHLTCPDGKTLYPRYDDENFYTLLRNNAIRKYEAYTKLPIEPDALTIRKHAVCEGDKNVSIFKETYITGWNGLYTLSADSHILEFLYHTGIGDRNSQGYGMFKLLMKKRR